MRYTGVDWSEPQIERNRARMPGHEFVACSLYRTSLRSGSFDAAISLYTIEHLCWPHLLLDEMFRLVRPGGLIAVLTPPFRQRAAIKSFDYGLSPRPFKDKIRTFRWLDAALHLYQHRVAYPRFLRRNHPLDAPEHRFLIHLEPVCLRSRSWFPDADAVYLTYGREMLDHLMHLGAEEIVLRPFECCVLARRRTGQPIGQNRKRKPAPARRPPASSPSGPDPSSADVPLAHWTKTPTPTVQNSAPGSRLLTR